MSTFKVDLKKCSVTISSISKVKKNLITTNGKLHDIKREINGLGSLFSVVSKDLNVLIVDMNKHKDVVEDLTNALKQCMKSYKTAEDNILGKTINIVEINDTIPGSNQDDGNTNVKQNPIAEFLLNIDDFRNSDVERILLKIVFGDYVVADILKIFDGTYLKTKNINGIIHMMLEQPWMRNNVDIIEWLSNNVGGDWTEYSARNMKDWNFSVFDTKKDSFTRDFGRYFDDITDTQMIKYFENLEDTGGSFFKNVKKNFNMFDDFDYSEFGEMSKFGKVGKVLGTAGTVFNIGSDAVDNFYDPNTGKWSCSGNQVADFAFDVAIDLGTSAGATALGAGVGSFFAPPIGTVVGAGAGFAIDTVANNVKLFDVDGDGSKDSLVDTVKIGAHKLVDGIEDGIDFIGNLLPF